MGDSNIPIIEPTIDFTKVPPIHQKRTISFVNHFVVNTVSFLNKLALNCEEKLYEFENKLQRVEAAVVLLESRLASIPRFEEKLTVRSEPSIPNDDGNKDNAETASSQEVTKDIDEIDSEIVDNEIVDNEVSNDVELQPICKHPLYEKYFKMKNFGASVAALKMNMARDGLDPDALDDPQRQVPKVNAERLEAAE